MSIIYLTTTEERKAVRNIKPSDDVDKQLTEIHKSAVERWERRK